MEEDDTKCRLSVIQGRYQSSLVAQLLEIQHHRTDVEKSIEWARNLQCLRPANPGRERRRRRRHHTQDGTAYEIDPTRVLERTRLLRGGWLDSSYVAVSYAWEPSEWESPDVGGYRIQSAASAGMMMMTGAHVEANQVRDVVLDRVGAYAARYGAAGFWIDSECINQRDPEEKEVAMQSMDLVYSMSRYPLGLLARPIETQAHLNVLLQVLLGKFLELADHPNFPCLKSKISSEMAFKALELLQLITSDRWWERAWIFQEEYLSSVHMDLLIPHHPGLRKERAWKVVGSLPGELCVNSADFRRECTLFCLAYLRESGQEWKPGMEICEAILQKAASYKVINRYPHHEADGNKMKAMSSTIFADIGHREITNAADILAIAANCCDYSVRLNTLSLKETKCSLSLCILALYLLNGEIFQNSQEDRHLLSSDIFDYLKTISLDNFDPPVQEKKLAFIKNCRFVNVRLSPKGIITTGLLWKLHREIDTSKLTSTLRSSPPPPLDASPSHHGLTPHERSLLRQLASELDQSGHRGLFDDLCAYLDEDLHSRKQRQHQPERSSRFYKDIMAKELVRAMVDGKTIQLGCLVGQHPYRGVFIRSSSSSLPPSSSPPSPSSSPERCPEDNYVFTAWKPRRRSEDDDFGWKRSEKYVSLEVSLLATRQGLPQLETKRWINGLCFFDGSVPQDVVFPWPASLEGLG